MKRVFIGFGQAGDDWGNGTDGLWHENLAVALAMRWELECHGLRAGISRERERAGQACEEMRLCEAFAPDLAVGVRCRRGEAGAFEAFRQTNRFGMASQALGHCIEQRAAPLRGLCGGVKAFVRADGLDWFDWLRECGCPAVLCVASPAHDAAELGMAYAHGVLDFLRIPLRGGRGARYAVVHQIAALPGRHAAEYHAAILNEVVDRRGWYRVVELGGGHVPEDAV